MSRRRGLSPEERELWSRVSRAATPLHPAKKQSRVIVDAVARPTDMKPVGQGPAAAVGLTPFRLGQTASTALSTASPRHYGASSPAQALADQPVRMDHKTHRRMTKGKLRPEARLDLHGMTLSAAHPVLVDFILSCRSAGLRLVLVITGKGRGDHGPLPTRPGALRHQVPHWLHSTPLSAAVQQVQAAHHRHGGEGAYYVYLRRQ